MNISFTWHRERGSAGHIWRIWWGLVEFFPGLDTENKRTVDRNLWVCGGSDEIRDAPAGWVRDLTDLSVYSWYGCMLGNHARRICSSFLKYWYKLLKESARAVNKSPRDNKQTISSKRGPSRGNQAWTTPHPKYDPPTHDHACRPS